MIAYLDRSNSPAGPLAFAVTERGALIRIRFLEGDYDATIEESLGRDGYEIHHDPSVTQPVRQQIEEYTRGDRLTFDLPLALNGTEWQRRVWRALTDIPFGQTRSYGEIASDLCTHRAARAVGRANGSNPIPLVVPCHRVVGADGSLTGFGGGLHLKTRLLEHEKRVLERHPNAPAGTQRRLVPAD